MILRYWVCMCLRYILEMGIFGREINLREEDIFIFGYEVCGIIIERLEL